VTSVANNTWDNGIFGNLWGDYSRRNYNASNDGVVWDTPYPIYYASGDADNKPLVCLPGNEPPIIDHPPDKEFSVMGDKSISWLATDNDTAGDYELELWLYQNGSLISNNFNTWKPGVPIVEHPSDLAVGNYNFTIIVMDGLGGLAWDTVIVTIVPIDPVLAFFINNGWIILGGALGVVGLVFLYHFYSEKKVSTK